MNRLTNLLSIFSLLGCLTPACSGKGPKSEFKDSIVSHPFAEREKIVMDYLQNEGLTQLNDTAKWYLYNIYCDDTIPAELNPSQEKIYLSYLNLIPLSCGWSADSARFGIVYSFIYADTLKVYEIDTKYGKMVYGIDFDMKNDKIKGFISGDGSYKLFVGPNSRFLNPIQLEMIPFLKANKEKLDNWYLTELRRRHIIE